MSGLGGESPVSGFRFKFYCFGSWARTRGDSPVYGSNSPALIPGLGGLTWGRQRRGSGSAPVFIWRSQLRIAYSGRLTRSYPRMLVFGGWFYTTALGIFGGRCPKKLPRRSNKDFFLQQVPFFFFVDLRGAFLMGDCMYVRIILF